jgi:hypothetical protein
MTNSIKIIASKLSNFIWAIFLRADIICLQLVKIDILDPLGGVLYTLLESCSCWIYKIQIWRHLDLKDPNAEN